ncbi:MAG: hypothetical protein HC831_07895 [Chloroflexia bacterium]|nr:hypothetical protein [Chloroflexia bacterium]
MKITLTLLTFLVVAFCSGQNRKNSMDFSGIYANEYGEISLKKLDSLKTSVSFKNNKLEVFDTLMFADYDFDMVKNSDSIPFLSFNIKAGIEPHPECLYVHEFSAGIYLSRFIWIEEMFVRPFYKIMEPVELKGEIKFSKRGATIDGIYLENYQSEQGYFKVTGTIVKEKYPKAYYSTSESPQGMFSDTNIIHYRLIMRDYVVSKPERQRFKGRLTNNFGKAAFVWEFADSEVYYLEGKDIWSEEMVGKEVVIEAVLVQTRKSAGILKKWRIIESEN